MSKTIHKHSIVTIEVDKDAVKITVRMKTFKERVELLRELAKVSEDSLDMMIYGMFTRGFYDQFDRELESTRELGRKYSEYLKHKYLEEKTSKA
jgi:hypothetical protein